MHRRAFLRLSPTAPLDGAPDDPAPDLAAAGITPRAHTPAPDRPYVPTEPLAIEAGLEPQTAPLNHRQAFHLLRRLGVPAFPSTVQDVEGAIAPAAVPALLDQALSAPPPPRPEWADAGFPRPPGDDATPEERDAYRAERDAYLEDNDEWILEYRSEWVGTFFQRGPLEAMALFWSDHFVTESEGYFNLAVYAYRYLELLRTHALGNFRDFVYDIGLNPAMLLYLNGNESVAGAPNENYARELLELFTMGQTDLHGAENYTQGDIEEIARALTGWVVDPFELEIYFIPERHDNRSKTIFGQTGTFDYDGVIDLLFAERARPIAEFVAAKLYRRFVYDAPGGGPVYNGLDPDLVSDLADVLLDADFEIRPAIEALTSSAHFFDPNIMGAQIKSPIAVTVGTMGDLLPEPPDPELHELLYRLSFIMQQRLLDPPNVAGWEEHHSWIDTTTLPIRWLVSDFLLYGNQNRPPIDLIPFAEEIHDPLDPAAAFHLPVAMAEHLLPIPLDDLRFDAPDEPFAGDLVNNPIPEDIANGPRYVLDLAKIFLGSVPWYEWSLYFDQSPALVLQFARYVMHLPEYQLT